MRFPPLRRACELGAAVILVFVAGCAPRSVPTELVAAATPIATTAPLSVPTPTERPVATPTPAPEATAAPADAEATTPAPELTAPPAPVEPTATAVASPPAAESPTAPVEPTAAATAVPEAAAQEPAADTIIEEPTPEATLEVAPEPTPVTASLARDVSQAGYVQLGVADNVALAMPAARVELIGFHEAGHPGSQAINPVASSVRIMTLESRDRGTAATSAADIVVPPGEVIRAPATGVVIAANSYVLYCDHDDDLVYIEPDNLPGWQVRMFHVVDVDVSVGDRVIAGETRIAASARELPFESQVDEFTAEPSWPHVHVEVVDMSVPDDRPRGPGCP